MHRSLPGSDETEKSELPELEERPESGLGLRRRRSPGFELLHLLRAQVNQRVHAMLGLI